MPEPDAPDPRPPRRRRYAGTHPRRFDERYKEHQPVRYPEILGHVRAQGRTPAGTHVPIMVAEVLDALRPRSGEVVADCTLGYGGHALELLPRISPGGVLIGLDIDGAQLRRSGERLADAMSRPESGSDHPHSPRISLHRSHFAGLAQVLKKEGLDGCDAMLADLGVSSMQIDDPARGFSYKHDGPLDMRMDDRLKRTAADLLATLPAEELSAALHELSDEPDHARLAAELVAARGGARIERTGQLVELVLRAKGLTRRAWRQRAEAGEAELHPAARTFQTLRILVNDELNGLAQYLRIAPYCLRPGGRMAIISFHSGEDRLVKHAFRQGLVDGVYARISEEVIRASPGERRSNPRSSPAKLRWAARS